MSESPYHKRRREAAEKLAALLALPVPAHENDLGCEGFFDPWPLFGLYGSYSSDFDQCAIEVLREINSGEKVRSDLAAEMFRELLCNLDWCEYGTSPRVCFPSYDCKALFPELISKWEALAHIQWDEDSSRSQT